MARKKKITKWRLVYDGQLSTLLIVIILVSTFLFSPPHGLNLAAWHLFGIFIATILSLILRPFPEPTIMIICGVREEAFKQLEEMGENEYNKSAVRNNKVVKQSICEILIILRFS